MVVELQDYSVWFSENKLCIDNVFSTTSNEYIRYNSFVDGKSTLYLYRKGRVAQVVHGIGIASRSQSSTERSFKSFHYLVAKKMALL